MTTNINVFTLDEQGYRHKVLGAMRTFLTYTIADAFDLLPEETMWTSYKVEKTLDLFHEENPKLIPLPVKYEMQSRFYSNKIAARINKNASPQKLDIDITHGSVEDWTEALSSTIYQCYPPETLVKAEVDGEMYHLLQELGIGHPTNPRAGKYLPSSLKYILTHK